MTAPEGKLTTVRKLLAKAEKAATEAEAEAYTAKAAELMARHGIDEALLEATGEKLDEITQLTVAMSNPYSREKATLLVSIADALRGRAVLNYRGSMRNIYAVAVLGFASDLERIEILYTSLLLQATTQVVRKRPEQDPALAWELRCYGRTESVASYRRTWLVGFAAAVRHRLHEAEAAAAQAAAGTSVRRADGSSTTGALVLVDRAARIEQAYQETFGHVKASRPRQLRGSGAADGYAAGQRADLSTGRHVGGRPRREIGA